LFKSFNREMAAIDPFSNYPKRVMSPLMFLPSPYRVKIIKLPSGASGFGQSGV
jgi:hypothetical protein